MGELYAREKSKRREILKTWFGMGFTAGWREVDISHFYYSSIILCFAKMLWALHANRWKNTSYLCTFFHRISFLLFIFIFLFFYHTIYHSYYLLSIFRPHPPFVSYLSYFHPIYPIFLWISEASFMWPCFLSVVLPRTITFP